MDMTGDGYDLVEDVEVPGSIGYGNPPRKIEVNSWLVVWNMNFMIFPYIGKNDPNWLSYFSEGLKVNSY